MYRYPFDLFACGWSKRPGELFLHSKGMAGEVYILDPHDSIDGKYKVLAVVEC